MDCTRSLWVYARKFADLYASVRSSNNLYLSISEELLEQALRIWHVN